MSGLVCLPMLDWPGSTHNTGIRVTQKWAPRAQRMWALCVSPKLGMNIAVSKTDRGPTVPPQVAGECSQLAAGGGRRNACVPPPPGQAREVEHMVRLTSASPVHALQVRSEILPSHLIVSRRLGGARYFALKSRGAKSTRGAGGGQLCEGPSLDRPGKVARGSNRSGRPEAWLVRSTGAVCKAPCDRAEHLAPGMRVRLGGLDTATPFRAGSRRPGHLLGWAIAYARGSDAGHHFFTRRRRSCTVRCGNLVSSSS